MPPIELSWAVRTDAGLQRTQARTGNETRFESFDADFHRALREGFRAIAAAEPQRCILIDAKGSVDEVANRIWSAVSERLTP